MRNVTLALLTSLGLAAMAGTAQAAGEGGCAGQRSVQSQPVDTPSGQAVIPAPATKKAG